MTCSPEDEADDAVVGDDDHRVSPAAADISEGSAPFSSPALSSSISTLSLVPLLPGAPSLLLPRVCPLLLPLLSLLKPRFLFS